ncbi:bZIP transcription factor 1 [Phytophthora citrophthora]|uniref:BZIP transcription factor 1 n=1 Tax=Phytophthora citrophthora TaxID=4793 RepID=A0AAD9GK87_9STRA|nr:bZIP transcription factor 1 [Phytophthora citrophthora]
MDSCPLNLSNTQIFSDTLIGHVVQRSSKQYNHEEDRRVFEPRARHRHTPYQQMRQRYPIDTLESSTEVASTRSALPSSIAGLIGTTLSSRRKRASCITSDLKTANQIIAVNHHATPEVQQAIVTEALKKKIRRREDVRIAQMRYREKQMKVEKPIKDAIAELKSEIKHLKTKSKDSFRIPITPTTWAVASEYVRQFSRYVASPKAFGAIASNFLHEMLDPDVLVGSLFGVEAALENWKLFTSYFFEDVRMELKGMKMPTFKTLVASTTTSVYITNKTLRNAFPHLIDDSGKLSPLATRLLGRN